MRAAREDSGHAFVVGAKLVLVLFFAGDLFCLSRVVLCDVFVHCTGE